MKYVKCNVKLLNEINLFTTTLVSAVNMISCLTEIKDNSSWESLLNKNICQIKDVLELNDENILPEQIYIEEKALIEKGITIINSAVEASKKIEFLAPQIQYLNTVYKSFNSSPVTYFTQTWGLPDW